MCDMYKLVPYSFCNNIRDLQYKTLLGDSEVDTNFLRGNIYYQNYINEYKTPYGYIYLTECLNNQMRYIGQHCKSKFDSKYYGSGCYFLKDLHSGTIDKSLMDRVVLDWGYSQEELDSLEVFWINYFKAYESVNYYNACRGGKFGYCYSGVPHTDEHKKKISEARKGYKPSELAICRMIRNRRSYEGDSNPFYGKHHTKETKDMISQKLTGVLVGEKNPMYHKTHTEEARRKISDANKGKVISKAAREKESSRLKRYYKTHEGHMKGKHHTEETKEKMSISRKGKKFTEEHKQNLSKSLKESAKNNIYKSSKKIRCIELDMEFKSTNEANRYLSSIGVRGCVYDAFRNNGVRGVVGGLTWERI